MPMSLTKLFCFILLGLWIARASCPRALPHLHESAFGGLFDRVGVLCLLTALYNKPMDTLTIAGRTFRSRLFVGTGKYRSFQEMARCHEASGAEVVTVAVRRVNLTDRSKESLLDFIDRT